MTTDLIRNAAPGDTLYDRDSNQSVKGLHLRVHDTGKRAFYFYYRTKSGQQRRPMIGLFGDITLTQARSIAKDLRERVAKGEDPKGEWNAKRAEHTIASLYEEVLEKYWSKKRFETSGWKRVLGSYWKTNIKNEFGSLKLSEVTAPRIRAWLDGYEHTKRYSANRSLEVLSRLFSYAEEKGYREPGSNPCSAVKAFTEKKRKRYATKEEILRLAPLLERELENYPRAVAFLYTLIYTGSRPSFLERAERKNLVRFEVNGMVFGRLSSQGKMTDKTGDDDSVIIPPQAMRVIDSLPPRIDGSLFGIKLPRKLWYRLRKEAGCVDLRARDLRRTFATVGMSGGLDMKIIGEVLNQKSAQTTMIYAKLMDDAKVEVTSNIADRMEKLLQPVNLGSPRPAPGARR
jgi:integrase